MNLRIVGALLLKDLALFFRNRFWALVTVLGLVSYVVIYFIMPSSVDESLKVGLYAPVDIPGFVEMTDQGLKIESTESEEALKDAVAGGRYVVGIALPAEALENPTPGANPKITVYFGSDTPSDVREPVELLIRELLYMATGGTQAVDLVEEVLGPDMVGIQIPPRDRMLPLFAVLLIMTETFGLATLISEEVERRTINALLVTPMAVKELFAAKGILGTGLSFGQAALFLALVGGLSGQPWIVLTALLLGALMVTGFGFLLAALGRDMMSVMAWGVFVVLAVPSVSVLFPGAASGWIELIPSYYLVDAVSRASSFGTGWADVGTDLIALVGFSLASLWIGGLVLRRRFQ